MAPRCYTLIDVPIDDLFSLDSVVRRLEYVRVNIHKIIPGVPRECEIDLIASGTAHNQGKIPLLGIHCPILSIGSLPDTLEMIDKVAKWVDNITTTELNQRANTIEAPTWAQLLERGAHPIR